MRYDVAVIWSEIGIGVKWTVGHWVTFTVGPVHATVFLYDPDTEEE